MYDFFAYRIYDKVYGMVISVKYTVSTHHGPFHWMEWMDWGTLDGVNGLRPIVTNFNIIEDVFGLNY